MSVRSLFSVNTGGSIDSTVKSDIVNSTKSSVLLNSQIFSGTSYKGSRHGVSSVLDGDAHSKAMNTKLSKIGSAGYKIAYKDLNGNALINQPVEFNKKAFCTNAYGELNIVNEVFINEEYHLNQEIEEYVMKILKRCKTDGILQTVLGLNSDEFEKVVKAYDYDERTNTYSAGCPEPLKYMKELLKFDCRPSRLSLYVPKSAQELGGFKRLYETIKLFMPVLDSEKTHMSDNEAPNVSLERLQTDDDGNPTGTTSKGGPNLNTARPARGGASGASVASGPPSGS